MFETRVKDLVLATLVADSYCLGSHWIYDETQLKDLKIDWENLSKACAIWHKDTNPGDFTHYGDQAFYLYKFLQNKESFDINDYVKYWQEKMSIYNGYIDGATRDTMLNLESGQEVPCGSESHDLSIIGQITPLLLVSSTKEEFLKNVELFVKTTHNNTTVVEGANFFATVLLEVLEGADIMDSIVNTKEKYSRTIQTWVQEGVASKEEDSFDAIRRFGPACGIEDGFAGVIHILEKYSNFKEAMINNAKAGGDNSARGMIIAMLLVARYGAAKIPPAWTSIKVQV